MAVVYTDLGDVWLLADLTAGHEPELFPWRVHLFKNDVTVLRGTVVGDMVEADYDGYAAQDLVREEWLPPQLVASTAYATYGTEFVEFLADSGTQRIYGYYVTPQDDSVLLFGERFDNFIDVSTVVPVLLRLTLKSRGEYPP